MCNAVQQCLAANNILLMRKGNRAFLLLAIALAWKWQIASLPKDIDWKNKLGDRMIKQLLNSVIAKYHDLSVSRRSIICLSRYFALPRQIIVNYILQLFRDFDYWPLTRGWPLNGDSTVERSPEQSHGAFCHQTDPSSRRPLKGNRDLTKLRRRRQRERQNSNEFNEQNDNSARASRFLVYFFAVPAKLQREMTKFWVDLRNGNGKPITFTISFCPNAVPSLQFQLNFPPFK